MICVNLIQMGSFTGQAVARIFKFIENVFIIERKHLALDTEKVLKTIFIFRFICRKFILRKVTSVFIFSSWDRFRFRPHFSWDIPSRF